MGQIKMSEEERFWGHVKILPVWLDSNWIWMKGKNADGYGQFKDKNGRMVMAHRKAYELFVGSIPEGLELDHLCRVRACVNPDHLELVTHIENIRRGKGMKGTRENYICGHPRTSENNAHNSRNGSVRCKKCHRMRYYSNKEKRK